MEEEKDIPICHGEPMIPVLRYKRDGRMVIRYQCGMRYCSEIVDVMVRTPEEEKDIEESLDLFKFMWKYAGEDP